MLPSGVRQSPVSLCFRPPADRWPAGCSAGRSCRSWCSSPDRWTALFLLPCPSDTEPLPLDPAPHLTHKSHWFIAFCGCDIVWSLCWKYFCDRNCSVNLCRAYLQLLVQPGHFWGCFSYSETSSSAVKLCVAEFPEGKKSHQLFEKTIIRSAGISFFFRKNALTKLHCR